MGPDLMPPADSRDRPAAFIEKAAVHAGFARVLSSEDPLCPCAAPHILLPCHKASPVPLFVSRELPGARAFPGTPALFRADRGSPRPSPGTSILPQGMLSFSLIAVRPRGRRPSSRPFRRVPRSILSVSARRSIQGESPQTRSTARPARRRSPRPYQCHARGSPPSGAPP